MDNDLISRSALRKEIDLCDIETFNDKYTICEQIAIAPAVDAMPVVHGYWKDTNYMIPTVACSVCRGLVHAEYTREYGSRGKYNFCPFCGAKMDLEEG